MRRFLSVWLVWIVVLLFSAALVAAYYPLTRSAEAQAEADLQLLVNAAFTRMDIAERNVEQVQRSANEAVLSKARAIARFLAHDDTLLATDALLVLCDLLDVQTIDVTDRDGKVVASSAEADLDRTVTEEEAFSWAAAAFTDEAELTAPDDAEKAVLYGCVARTDTEGVVIVKMTDAALQTAIESSLPENVLGSMAFIRDDLVIADAPGTDDAYIMDGYFCLRQSRGNVSVIAMRLLGTIYVVRNAVMLMIAVCMLVSILAATIIQLCIPVGGRGKRSRVSMRHVSLDLPSLDEPDESELARLIENEAAELPPVSGEEVEYAAMEEAYGEASMQEDAAADPTDDHAPDITESTSAAEAATEHEIAPEEASFEKPAKKRRAPRRRKKVEEAPMPIDDQDSEAPPADDDAEGFDKVF